MPPGLTCVRRFEKSQGGTGINDVRSRRVLGDDVRAPVGPGDALQLDPGVAGIIAAVNTTASAGKDQFRPQRIDTDRKYVRIVDQTVVNRSPGLAAIYGFPGQMRSTGVNY